MIKFAIDIDNPKLINNINLDLKSKVSPLNYRAIEIALKNTITAFKPERKVKPWGNPCDSKEWLKLWSEKEVLNARAGFNHENKTRAEVIDNIKENINSMYKNFSEGKSTELNYSVVNVGKPELSHPRDVNTPIELMPCSEIFAIAESIFYPYYNRVKNQKEHPIRLFQKNF